MSGAVLAALVLALVPAHLVAQEGKLETPPHKMLYSFLLKEAQKHFDARRDVIANLKTPEQIKARQAELNKKFWEALGDMPEKTPLNAKVVGTVKADGYRVEKIIFESRPEHHVTAALYIPDGKGPFPGVLIPCGHSATGKAIEAYQRASILMAKNGMAALCYDPIGQGERLQLLDKAGKAGVPGSTSEHTMVGVGALLVGRSTASYRIWDGIRAMDYLESRPEIDPKKLGCTGNSGGGTLTAYLMALDDRIVCAAPSCYITSLERLFVTLGPQDAEQNITGQVAFGMEHADYLTMRAPRPTLMAVGTQDFFDIKGAKTTFQEASEIYKKMGAEDRMAFFEYDDKHGWSKPRREACMRWMRKWLLGIDDNPAETSFPIFKDEELQCTRSGQVLEDFRGVSVFDLNRMRGEELAKERAKFVGKEVRIQKELVRKLIRLPDVDLRKLNPRVNDQALFLETEQGIGVSNALLGGERKKAPAAIILHDQHDQDGQVAVIADTLTKAHSRVISVSLRGHGFTAPGKMKADKRSYFGADSKEYFLSLHLDRPLLGQRTYDLVCFLSFLRDEDYHLVAIGNCGPIALHAAAIDGRVKTLTITHSLISWSNVIETPVSYDQLTNVVPGVLKHYDLPELATMIAPRPLTIRNAVDAQGRPVSQKVLEETYRVTRGHYEGMKMGRNLVLETK